MRLEIVVCRFNETLEWCNKYKDIVTVYNKGLDDIDFDFTRLPNIGRDPHTYVTHIIRNWDNLADHTFFAQGNVNDRPEQTLDLDKVVNFTNENEVFAILFRDNPRPSDHLMNYYEPFGKIYEKIFDSVYNQSDLVWAAGLWIRAPRKLIKNCPLEIYKKIVSFLEEETPSMYSNSSIDYDRHRACMVERLLLHAMTRSYD